MRKLFFLSFIFLIFASPCLFAQKRIEAGVFLDYLDVTQTSTNNFGVGGRFGYRVHHHVMLEGCLLYTSDAADE